MCHLIFFGKQYLSLKTGEQISQNREQCHFSEKRIIAIIEHLLVINAKSAIIEYPTAFKKKTKDNAVYDEDLFLVQPALPLLQCPLTLNYWQPNTDCNKSEIGLGFGTNREVRYCNIYHAQAYTVEMTEPLW